MIDTRKLLIESTYNFFKSDCYDVYFAGPWFSKEDLEYMYTAIEIYNNYKLAGGKLNVFFPMLHQKEKPSEVFKSNMDNIVDCKSVIAMIHSKDTGTAFEIGVAKALDKDLHLLVATEEDFYSKTNIMLAHCTELCIAMKDFYKYLECKLNPGDYIKVKDDWEGKE